MTILFLTRRFWPQVGGVEKHIESILPTLIKHKHKVIIVSENTRGYKDHEFAKRVEIFRIPVKDETSKKWSVWFWLWKNRNLIKEADVIHAHDVSYWFFPFKLLYPRKKFFITFHGYASFPLDKREIYLRKISEHLSSGNILVGNYIKKWFKTVPDYVIYGGVNIPKKYNSAINKKGTLFIGRLEKQTGIETYANAVRILRNKIRDFKFTVVGEGEYKNFLLDFNLTGVQENTQRYFDNTNFVFASGYLTILEAMANKRLVFAVYDNDLKKDYLRMTPFWKYIILSSDSQDLAKKVEHYLKNQKEAEDITNQAFEWVQNNTWESVAEKYLKLWEK